MQTRQSITGVLDTRSASASPIDDGAKPLNPEDNSMCADRAR
jgi:hypothetical protein